MVDYSVSVRHHEKSVKAEAICQRCCVWTVHRNLGSELRLNKRNVSWCYAAIGTGTKTATVLDLHKESPLVSEAV